MSAQLHERFSPRAWRLARHLGLVLLSACQLIAAQSSPPECGTARQQRLKTVALDRRTIQVPECFTIERRGPNRIGPVPSYLLRAPSHQIEIYVLPFSSYETPVDEKTRMIKLPVSLDGGPPLTSHFKLPGGQVAYYGWSVTDTAYACTMNTPCPHRAPPKTRYQTLYDFAVLDGPEIVEFRALVSGPTKTVTGFEGDAKLLRDVIIPSLRSTSHE